LRVPGQTHVGELPHKRILHHLCKRNDHDKKEQRKEHKGNDNMRFPEIILNPTGPFVAPSFFDFESRCHGLPSRLPALPLVVSFNKRKSKPFAGGGDRFFSANGF
jgi:hypothetical protein